MHLILLLIVTCRLGLAVVWTVLMGLPCHAAEEEKAKKEEQKAALEPLCRLIKDILGDKVCAVFVCVQLRHLQAMPFQHLPCAHH